MRLVNSSVYYHHQHHPSSPASSLPFYLHLSALLSQHSSASLLLLSLPPSFISAEMLSSSIPHLFFYCHCCRLKALGFPPSISQDRAAITVQERRRPAVQGSWELYTSRSRETKMWAPLRGNGVKLLIFRP